MFVLNLSWRGEDVISLEPLHLFAGPVLSCPVLSCPALSSQYSTPSDDLFINASVSAALERSTSEVLYE